LTHAGTQGTQLKALIWGECPVPVKAVKAASRRDAGNAVKGFNLGVKTGIGGHSQTVYDPGHTIFEVVFYHIKYPPGFT
jgi:hypothetical protein